MTSTNSNNWEGQIKAQIRRRYASQAKRPAPGGGAKAVETGYPADLINNLPTTLTANYSGCGYLFSGMSFNGTETVINLGAGGGLDSFIAAQQVPNGMVISIDMTIEMLQNINTRNIHNLCAGIVQR